VRGVRAATLEDLAAAVGPARARTIREALGTDMGADTAASS
jgi:hypothetical protein